jgi:5'-3' exonuclease
MNHTLIIDGANFLHRARSGFALGDYAIVYNTLRSLRPICDWTKPTRVVFTLEGRPKRQLALLPEYKANRFVDPNDLEKVKSNADFHRQSDVVVDLLKKHFPVSVVQHSDFEADDLIYNVILSSSTVARFTVVSTDTDFTQLLQEFNNVELYNPVKKKYVEAPPYDYVRWKALRGDASDNIPHLPGINNDAIAVEFFSHGERFEEALVNTERFEEFKRNVELIQFKRWTDEERLLMRSSTPTRDWEKVRELFKTWNFNSLLKEGTWDKFVNTFEPLWGNVG